MSYTNVRGGNRGRKSTPLPQVSFCLIKIHVRISDEPPRCVSHFCRGLVGSSAPSSISDESQWLPSGFDFCLEAGRSRRAHTHQMEVYDYFVCVRDVAVIPPEIVVSANIFYLS